MYVKVYAKAGARKDAVAEDAKRNCLIVHTREPARRGFANKSIVALVARHFGVPVSNVRIISGHHAPSKMLAVESPH